MLEQERARFQGQLKMLAERLPRQQDPKDVVRQALKMAGYDVPEDQPEYLTAQQVHEMLAERDQGFQMALSQRDEIATANVQLERLKAQHPDYFDPEGRFESLIAARWGSMDGTYAEAFNEAKAIMDAYADRRAQQYDATKRQHGQQIPVRPGGGTPSRTTRPVIDLAAEGGMEEAVDALLDAEGGA
jgi:hypothetical protein